MAKAKERFREQVISALLSSRSVEVAAKKVGVSAKTLGLMRRIKPLQKWFI